MFIFQLNSLFLYFAAIETKGNKHPVHWIEYYWIKYSLNGKHWQKINKTQIQ